MRNGGVIAHFISLKLIMYLIISLPDWGMLLYVLYIDKDEIQKEAVMQLGKDASLPNSFKEEGLIESMWNGTVVTVCLLLFF